MAKTSSFSVTSLRTLFSVSLACSLLSVHMISKAETIPSLTESSAPESKNVNQKKRDLSLTKALPKPMLDELLSNMVLVEAGSFSLGSDSPLARKREQPVRPVTLDSFYISKYELTQDIFEQVMGWNYSYFQCGNCPVNNVSWFNMQLFIERLNGITGKKFSLPTEAQWAYAAKGGNKSKGFKYSGSNTLNDVAWFADNANKKSHPVGLKQPNELGLYDMTGNLWEFCLDDMSRKAYSRIESHNPFIGDKKNLKRKAMKVIRGGGYEFNATENLVFMRDGATNNVRMPDIGYRLVMSTD
ncbi:formylglycine-generating enzyme family protein [Colwellia sp. 75C3]|uniref:formylglycine-generating enzyme family protein n=1 Tax=Colwellia sp. 75C3 TaxID=888425 RepID=UPI0018E3AC1B|nr:SUMF1/EgtB/PvdO family nonheme iron enzyme [Colwellia sp. 75C3]